MKNILIATALSAVLLSGCSTLQANGYETSMNNVPVSQQEKKGMSTSTIALLVVGSAAIAYMGLSTGNKNKTDQGTIDARDACRAAATNEYEWQQC